MTNIEKCLNGADALKPMPKRTIMLKSVINGELRITEVETVTGQLLPQMQAVANRIFGINNWSERLGWSYSANKNNYGYEITNCAGSFLWVAYEP